MAQAAYTSSRQAPGYHASIRSRGSSGDDHIQIRPEAEVPALDDLRAPLAAAPIAGPRTEPADELGSTGQESLESTDTIFPTVRVHTDYNPRAEDHGALVIRAGDIITVTHGYRGVWWEGTTNRQQDQTGQNGWFLTTHVERIQERAEQDRTSNLSTNHNTPASPPATLVEGQEPPAKSSTEQSTHDKPESNVCRPYLLVLLLLNLSLWVLLAVQSIRPARFEKYHRIFMGYSIAAGGAAALASLGVYIYKSSKKAKTLVVNDYLNYANAVLCWGLSLAYVYSGAMPAYYENPNWELSTSYNGTINMSGFSIIGGYNDAAMAIMHNTSRCTFPRYDEPCSTTTWPSSSHDLSLDYYGPDLKAFHLDSSGMVFNNSWNDLVLQISVSYNKSKVQHSYSEQAVQTPYLFSAMYDYRIGNLTTAIDCGLIGLTEIPALASSTFRFSSAYLTDEKGMIDLSNATDDCRDAYKQAFELKNAPYTTYTFHIASMPVSDASLCDTTLNPTAQCIMQSILRIDKPVIEGMESVPGVERADIWLNVAAIVGGVQFLCWFIGVLL